MRHITNASVHTKFTPVGDGECGDGVGDLGSNMRGGGERVGGRSGGESWGLGVGVRGLWLAWE